MAEDELLLQRGQLQVDESLRQRVSQLFGVSVRYPSDCDPFVNDGGGSTLTRLLVSSLSGSQDDLEKAKKYLKAFFEEGPNFVKLSNIYPPESYAMVHERNSEIEKLTQVVLDYQEEPLRISMQGNMENIRAAKQIIDDLVKGKSPTLTPQPMCAGDIEIDGGLGPGMMPPLHGSKSHLDSHNNNMLSDDNDKPFPSPSCKSPDSCVRLGSRRGSLQCEATLVPGGMDDCGLEASVDLQSWPPSDARDKLDCPGHRVDNNGHCRSSPRTLSPTSSSSPPPVLSPPSLPDSRTEGREEESRALDQEYKVQRALKLGYSEDDALMALARVGANADENDYLAELISLGSKSFNSLDSDPSTCTSGEQEFGSGLVATPSLAEKTDSGGDDGDNLRYIVIDGSNVAMSHGKKEVFSCLGIKLAVDWFRQRGHKKIKVFVPQWRKEASRPEAPITDQEILTQLEKEDVLVFTPARRIAGRRVVCYDDRYVLKLASEEDGIVVSNDNYRDLLNARADYRKVVEERLLMYSFVNDKFMPPDDPLGRKGPTLDNFLRIRPTVPEPLPPECPYGKKCTYGNKCRYYHPERGCLPQKSVTDRLAEQAKLKMQERRDRLSETADKKGKRMKPKTPLARTISCVPDSMRGSSSPFSLSQGKDAQADTDLQLQRSQSMVDDYNEKLNEHRRKLNMAVELQKLQPGRHTELGERSSAPILDPSSRCSPTVLIQAPQASASTAAPTRTLDMPLLAPQRIPSPTLDKEGGGVMTLPSPSRSSPSSQLLTPTSSQQQSDGKGFISGHLLLAKKLSDEDSKKFRDDSDRTQSPKEGEGGARALSAGVTGFPTMTTVPPATIPQAATSDDMLHQAMANLSFPSQQQISSPRHSAHQSYHHSFPISSPHPMDMYYGQEERCQSGPAGQGQHQPDSMFSLGGLYDPYQSFPLMERGHSQHPPMAALQPKQQGFINGSQQQQQQQQQRQQANLMPQQPGFQGAHYDDSLYGSEHLAVSRLQSAPTHLYQTHTQPQPRPITRMARQNSSSDPQLHTLGMEEDAGLLSRGTLPYPPADLNMPSLDLFESSPSHRPHHSHPHSSSQTHLHPLQHSQQPSHHSSPSHQPPHSYSRSASLHPSGPYSPQHQYLPVNRQTSYTVPNSPLTPQHSQHPSWQDSYSQAGHHSGHDSWALGGGMLSPPSPSPQHMPPPPPTQMGVRPSQAQHFNPSAQILPSDPRYNLYYHLRGLFPEEKVRVVMNQHPNETNPQALCTYIINLKL